jgi:DNA-binding CsgD family transcriptional regulator
MLNLTRQDLEEVLKLVSFCMARIKTGNVEPKGLLMEMLKFFRSNDVVFFPSNKGLNGADLSSAFSLMEGRDALTRYANYYWRYDPLFEAQFSPEPVNQVFKTDDIISYSRLKKLDYYREYLQSINHFGELVIRLCTDEGFLGTMSICRSSKEPYFNRNDVEKAKFLLPYLISTFEATMLFSKINGERKAFEQWLETRPEGVIVLDARLHSVFFNNKAAQICQLLSGSRPELLPDLENASIMLPKSILDDCCHLFNTHDNEHCFSNNRIINTQTGERYYIKHTLVNQPCQDISLPYFIININELSKNEDGTEVFLLKDYDLSEREENIAQYIGMGLTNKEIGNRFGISPFTVQSHLRNIFEKTGIKRRAQLANLVK